MKQGMFKWLSFTISILLLNTAGIIWIHHSLTKGPQASVFITDAGLRPDHINPDRISIQFDRDVIGPDNVMKEAEAELFTFTPQQGGKWLWRERNVLEFQFDEPLAPGRIYNIKALPCFRDITGMVIAGQDSFRLETISLMVDSCRIISEDPHSVSFEINFNQPVDPGELLRYVAFYDTGVEPPNRLEGMLCLTQEQSDSQVVKCNRPGSDYIEVVLNDKLTGPGADLSLGSEVIRKFRLSQGFVFLNSHVSKPRLEEDISVRLGFSKKLDRQSEIPALTIVPAVEGVKTFRNGNNLILTGRFESGNNYRIAIPGILISEDRETLGEDHIVQVDIPERETALFLKHGEGILRPLGGLELEMKSVNVPEVKLTAWRVHDNNLIPYLHGNRIGRTGQFIYDKVVELDDKPGTIQESLLGLKDMAKSKPGIYYVKVASTQRKWTSDSTIVTVTDLGITVKKHPGGVLVWVTSLRTGKPVPGALIKAMSYNNQVLISGETDGNGIAELSFPDDNPDGGMWVVTAQKEDDISYIRPSDNQWILDDLKRSGRRYPQGLEVMMYTERGVYRPGDTIHLSGLIREETGHVPPVFPVTIKAIRPDGREVAEMSTKLQNGHHGLFHVDFETTDEFQTGVYTFQAMLPGTNKIIGTVYAYVEAFVPLKMKVDSKPVAERFDPNDMPEVSIEGRYLWDQPATDVPVKVEATLRQMWFNSEIFEGFVFGPPVSSRLITVDTVKGKLDNEGKTRIGIVLPKNLAPAVYRMYITATVTEPGARSVSCNTNAIIDKLDHHIGLKRIGTIVKPDEVVTIEWVSITGRGKAVVPGNLQMRLSAVEYESVVKEVNGRRVWRSIEKLKEIKSGYLDFKGLSEGLFQLICPDAGMYRLEVFDDKSGSRTRMDLYSSAYSHNQTFDMTQPERLEVITDKERYQPGETAEVLVRSPLAGVMLLTVEADRITEKHVAQFTEKSLVVNVPLAKELRGSAYITATIVRKVDPDGTNWLPHRAFGAKRLELDHGNKAIDVRINAVDETEPQKTVKVDITMGDVSDPNQPGVVHLWAVDEGILLTTGYEVPDAFEFFLSPRSPAVFSSDIFYRLLPDYQRPESMARIGSGQYNIGPLRRNQVKQQRRKPDVIWREDIITDKDGKASVQMKMPDLIGQMRLMAVAVDGDRYGKARKDIVLTSDIIAESAWPRFVSPGDDFVAPVKLFNTTDKDVTVGLLTKIEGPVRILDDSGGNSIKLEPGKPVIHYLKVGAMEEPGAVNVTVTAVEIGNSSGSNPLTAVSKGAFIVRPAAALHTEVQMKSIDAGQEVHIEPSESFVNGTQELTIDVSPRPEVHLAGALEKLVSYPYGCVEQTTSKVYSLLYAGRILGKSRADSIRNMVQAGIMRLWTMQTRSGGLSYWPGGTEPDRWGSIYVGRCLLEARQAGYDIDNRFSVPLIKYLQSLMDMPGNNEISRNDRAQLCHVLSGFDVPPYGWMNRLAEQKHMLDPEAIAYLCSAFYSAGQTDRSKSLLSKELMEMSVETTTHGRLTSQLQQRAVLLSILLEIDPQNEMVDLLAKFIVDERTNGCWRSTLENSAAIVALSRYELISGRNVPDYTGQMLLPNENQIDFDDKRAINRKVSKLTEAIVIRSRGTGRIYITLSSEGLGKKELMVPYARKLHVERRWLDREGKPVDPNNLHVGDLVNVEVDISTKNKKGVSNIAVVDLLCGGMEVENPHLITSARSQQSGGSRADHVEFLDDRVVLFCSVNSSRQTFKYALRVVTEGVFELGPIQASCMYDPSFAFLGDSEKVIVKP